MDPVKRKRLLGRWLDNLLFHVLIIHKHTTLSVTLRSPIKIHTPSLTLKCTTSQWTLLARATISTTTSSTRWQPWVRSDIARCTYAYIGRR